MHFLPTSKTVVNTEMVGTKDSYNRLVSVGCSLEEFVQLQENKNSLSKAKRDVSLLKKF